MKIQILASDPDINGVKTPTGIRITNLPKSGLQRLPAAAIERHKDYVSMEDGKIVFHTLDGDVDFLIVHEPGRFCLTCDERLPDFGGNGTMLEASRAQQCRDHVKSHGTEAEKSAKWKDGYQSYPNTFECTVEDKR